MVEIERDEKQKLSECQTLTEQKLCEVMSLTNLILSSVWIHKLFE